MSETNCRSLSYQNKIKLLLKQQCKCANVPGSKLYNIGDYKPQATFGKCLLWKYENGVFDDSGFETDHIVEYALSNDTSLENSQLLCPSCHAVKTKNFLQSKSSIISVDDSNNKIKFTKKSNGEVDLSYFENLLLEENIKTPLRNLDKSHKNKLNGLLYTLYSEGGVNNYNIAAIFYHIYPKTFIYDPHIYSNKYKNGIWLSSDDDKIYYLSNDMRKAKILLSTDFNDLLKKNFNNRLNIYQNHLIEKFKEKTITKTQINKLILKFKKNWNNISSILMNDKTKCHLIKELETFYYCEKIFENTDEKIPHIEAFDDSTNNISQLVGDNIFIKNPFNDSINKFMNDCLIFTNCDKDKIRITHLSTILKGYDKTIKVTIKELSSYLSKKNVSVVIIKGYPTCKRVRLKSFSHLEQKISNKVLKQLLEFKIISKSTTRSIEKNNPATKEVSCKSSKKISECSDESGNSSNDSNNSSDKSNDSSNDSNNSSGKSNDSSNDSNNSSDKSTNSSDESTNSSDESTKSTNDSTDSSDDSGSYELSCSI